MNEKIKTMRAYLDKRRIPRTVNPKVRYVESYRRGLYRVYRWDSKGHYIVQSLGTAWEARDKAETRKIIKLNSELCELLHLVAANDPGNWV